MFLHVEWMITKFDVYNGHKIAEHRGNAFIASGIYRSPIYALTPYAMDSTSAM